jgi:hypothetical protein
VAAECEGEDIVKKLNELYAVIKKYEDSLLKEDENTQTFVIEKGSDCEKEDDKYWVSIVKTPSNKTVEKNIKSILPQECKTPQKSKPITILKRSDK